jgi:hypothetical protein
MTNEEAVELQKHIQAIAKILYKDVENTEPEKLNTLEGIEISVRQQVQKYVNAEIGVFLLGLKQAPLLAGQDS